MRCSKCKIETGKFIKYAKSKYGIQYYYCRKCNTKRSKEYRQTENGKINTRKAVAKSIDKHREKQNTRKLTKYYILKGEIIKSDDCEECGSKGTLFVHHNNYEDAFDILWLCGDCHLGKHY